MQYTEINSICRWMFEGVFMGIDLRLMELPGMSKATRPLTLTDPVAFRLDSVARE